MYEIIETYVPAVAPATTQGDWGIWGMIGYIALIFAVIYFLIIRPNKKRMGEYQKMIEALKVGGRVMAAGIYGKIKKINEKSLELEIAKGVVVEVNKQAVASVE